MDIKTLFIVHMEARMNKSFANSQQSIELQRVNSIIWIDMKKSLSIGHTKHRYTAKIPNYCEQIKRKRLSLKDSTLTKMMEKAEVSCNHMRREVYLPNLRTLESFKFNPYRSKRSDNLTEIDELRAIVKKNKLEAAC